MKSGEFVYKYKNKDYLVHVTIKRQRNIYYRYKEDGFYVTAPYFTTQKTIVMGLEKFGERLLNQHAKLTNNFSTEEDYFYLLGEKYSLSEFNLQNTMDFQHFLQEKAQFFITELVRKNEEIMGISQPYKVKVRDTKRQFGSNSKQTHTLSFQINLVHYSKEIIESVVIHELAHDFERNHGKNFYNIVYSYCPRYKELQRKLKKGIHK